MNTTALKSLDQSSYLDELLRERVKLPAAPDAAMRLREQGMAAILSQSLPTVRDEDWRFTDLAPLYKHMFHYAVSTPRSTDEYPDHHLPETEHSRLVFVNGHFAPTLSSRRLADGVTLCSFTEAWTQPALAARLEAELGARCADREQVFAALNTAFLHDGALIVAAADTHIENILHVIFIGTAAQQPLMAFPRCLVIAERGSRCTVIEEYAGMADATYFTAAVTEVDVRQNAHVEHIKLQREASNAFHIGHSAVTLARDADYRAVNITLGARLSRHEVSVLQADENTRCSVKSLNLLAARQLADTHSCIDHAHAHGNSEQLHKCIVDDAAHAVFNGKILVRRNAQLTQSAQQSRNLLLSDKARVNTKPELQINADDVKCAHGATIGQLDMDELFYLRSRGLTNDSARRLLTYAFAAEIINAIPATSMKKQLRAHVLQQTAGARA